MNGNREPDEALWRFASPEAQTLAANIKGAANAEVDVEDSSVKELAELECMKCGVGLGRFIGVNDDHAGDLCWRCLRRCERYGTVLSASLNAIMGGSPPPENKVLYIPHDTGPNGVDVRTPELRRIRHMLPNVGNSYVMNVVYWKEPTPSTLKRARQMGLQVRLDTDRLGKLRFTRVA